MILFIRRNLSLVVFVVIAFAFRWSLADQYYVPSGSMEPNVEIGDRILVNKMAYDLKVPYTTLHVATIGEPVRGDIVVFENPKDGVTMVKRLIGLPGDHIVIDDGFISINGERLAGSVKGARDLKESEEALLTYEEQIGERMVTIKRLPLLARKQHFDLVVPANSYFAMGDNRDNSLDSRGWGFIPRERLKGRAFAVFWSMRFENFVPHVNFARVGQKLK